jgi:hypothetical protein
MGATPGLARVDNKSLRVGPASTEMLARPSPQRKRVSKVRGSHGLNKKTRKRFPKLSETVPKKVLAGSVRGGLDD